MAAASSIGPIAGTYRAVPDPGGRTVPSPSARDTIHAAERPRSSPMTSTDAPRGPDTAAPPPDPDTTVRPRAGAAALAGVVAAGSALGVVSLLGRAVGDARPLDVSVGDEVIDRSPGWVVRWAIDVFGTNDKPALRVGIVVTALVLGAV